MPNPYLTFSSLSSFTLNVIDNSKYWDGTLEYSTDTTTWNTWDGTTTLSSASDGTNHNLYLRGTGNTYITGSSYSSTKAHWVLTGSNISCSGNIENLLDYATVSLGNHPVMAMHTFRGLFRGNSNLISAPELPATTLANNCYASMFYICSGLATAPSLPATTLTTYCYFCMFYGCTALTTTPPLPATTLADYCYQQMFCACTALTTLPELPVATLTKECYEAMFYDCSLIKISETQTKEYQTPYRIPSEGTGTSGTNSLGNMFKNTGGSYTGEPTINTTYYTSNTIIPAVEPTSQPSISIGTLSLAKAILGTKELSAIWLGNVKLYEGTPAPVAIKCVVNNLGSSSPSSVVFTKDASFTNQGLGIEEVTIGNDVFIKIPTMYRKVDTVVSNQITKFTISNAKIDNTYEPYPCFLDESGNLLEYILIGKYWISSTTVANSVNASVSSMAIGTGRTLCQAKTDASYQGLLYDWQIHKLWQDLIICAKQTVNTNNGTAWTTDELGIYWGTNGCWIDGLTYNSGSLAVSYKPSAYTDNATSSTTDYVSIGYTIPSATSGANIVKLDYDSNNPFVNMPSSASGTSYTTYYCDALYTSSENHPFFCRVGYAYAISGAFFSYFNDSWSSTHACRLCLRPKV